MNMWAENPEWFDEWIWEQALDGRLGEEIRLKCENEEIEAYDLWDYDKDGKLGGEAQGEFMGSISRRF
ncbi:MAG: hypothetical protein KAS32_04235 [Candidatus Peribacteraceae bacterium]|nr:hypothetical protein [Candidatus Peribacteraceae bacterium]